MEKIVLAFLTSLILATPVWAQVAASEPWVRGTVAQQKATGAFMKLTAQTGSRLMQASSPVAGMVEIHEMAIDNNVMKMRQIPGLELPAGKTVKLKPGGYHVLLMDLKQQMKDGESVPIALIFGDAGKKRESVEIKAMVRPLNASAEKHDVKHKH